ncbi:protein KASH5-like [Heptranchias perlo]|uniref:protein KASH5-like n=1 Tax=Heptranchias perlo TaxID=212740 RepID=UPI003559C77E
MVSDNVLLGKFKASGGKTAKDFVFHEPRSDGCVLQEMMKEMGNMEEVYRQLEKQNNQLEQQRESLLGQFTFYEQEIDKLENQRCQQEHIVEDMISKAKFLHEVLDEARILSEDRDHIITVKNLYIDQLMNTLEMMLKSNMHLKDECTHLQKELKSLEITHLKGLEQAVENDVQPETPRASSFTFCFPFLHRNKTKAPKDKRGHSLRCK